MITRAAATAAMMSFAATAALAQHDTTVARGEVTGRVVDAVTHAPIAGARVEVLGTAIGVLSGDAGAFRLTGIAPGVVQVRTRAVGYRPALANDVVVSTGKPAELLVALTQAPLVLEQMRVSAPAFSDARETPTSTQELTSDEIRRSPGAQEDVVRAVSLLPGVAPTMVHRNDLVVRGGAPFENLFIVDGLEVPSINHFTIQGSSGGLNSLVNLDFVRTARFSAGAFGVAHGDRSGSATTIALREGVRERHGGEANFAVTGFGAMAEGPVGRGSYLAGIRRSYLDLVLQAAGEPFFTRYWDANVKVAQRYGRNELSWTLIGAVDDWGFNAETPDDLYDAALMAVNDDQYFTSLNWSRWGTQSHLQVTLGRSAHAFDTFQNDTLGATIFTNRSDEVESSLRVAYTRTFSGGSIAELGATAKHGDRLRYTVRIPGHLRTDASGAPQPFDLDTALTATRVGSWGELRLQWMPRFSTTLGVRVDHYESARRTLRAAPRLAATLELGETSSLNAAVGRYWQPPSFVWLVGDQSNARNLAPFRVDQAVVGVQKMLRPDLKLQVEAYAKRYDAYPARVWRPQAVLASSNENVQIDIPFGLEPLVSAGKGTSYGAELSLQKRLSELPFYGLASVSLNRTRFEGLDGVARRGAYDVPIVANLAGGWRPAALWDLGARFRVASGVPITPFMTSGAREGTPDFTRYNEGGRMPAFHALDVRIDRRWPFRSLQLTTYLDLQDVYNRNNPIAHLWDYRTKRPKFETAIGFMPSIGINVEF